MHEWQLKTKKSVCLRNVNLTYRYSKILQKKYCCDFSPNFRENYNRKCYPCSGSNKWLNANPFLNPYPSLQYNFLKRLAPPPFSSVPCVPSKWSMYSLHDRASCYLSLLSPVRASLYCQSRCASSMSLLQSEA